MHEVSVVTALVDAVLDELSSYDLEKVDSVTVLIGDLTNLGEEQMAFAYGIVTEGTALEGSSLIVEHVPIEAECKACGYRGPVRMLGEDAYGHAVPVLACPECGGPIEVLKGSECAVKCMDIQEKDRCSNTETRRPPRRYCAA